MIKRQLGNTGMNVSAVTYGGIVSMQDGQDYSDQYVAYAIQHGVNYFDVAPSYGDAQEKLGNSLVPYRKDVYLACKTEQRTAEGVKRELEESLRLLHTDYFDNYQMHCIRTMDQVETVFGPGGAMETLIRAKEEGVVKHISITGHGEAAIMECLKRYDGFSTVLFPTNWGMNMASGFGDELIAMVKERKMGLLGMKSFIERAWINQEERLKSGFVKSWCRPIIGDEAFTIAAMKYALSMGIDTLVPPGDFHHFAFAVEHIDQCLSDPLTEDEMNILQTHLPMAREYPVFLQGGTISNRVNS